MTIVNTLFVLFSCISDFKPNFNLRLQLLLCFLYSWFLGWLIVFILSFFFSLQTCLSDSFHFLSVSLHFSVFLLSPPLSCSLFVHAASGTTFFFWLTGRGGFEGRGTVVECRWRGERASKTKRGCLLAGQAGNANLTGLPPSRCSFTVMLADCRLRLTAPLSPCSTVPFVHPSLLFVVGIFIHFSPFFLSCIWIRAHTPVHPPPSWNGLYAPKHSNQKQIYI